MKLRNKKTGEIIDTLNKYDCSKGISFGADHHDGSPTIENYNSLAELNEEWEDYKEPKEYWFITGRGEVGYTDDENTGFDKDHKSIGNYFESKEEAEKAVEKLKAWKKLREWGFEFCGGCVDSKIEYFIENPPLNTDGRWNHEIHECFDLLFGGEE